MRNGPLRSSVLDGIPPVTFEKCETFTYSLTADFD